jgi:hypothetical protein
MSTHASTIIPADDKQAVLAALQLLGVKVRSAAWPDNQTVEVWASHPDDREEEGGFKFTFKHGSLTELHVRALTDPDVVLAVRGSSPGYKDSDGSVTYL